MTQGFGAFQWLVVVHDAYICIYREREREIVVYICMYIYICVCVCAWCLIENEGFLLLVFVCQNVS